MNNPVVELFNESGMTIREFSEKAGLKYGTARDIVKGVANIENVGAGAFVRIAKTLGTTADALMGATKDSVLPLSPAELELLSLFRRMGARERELLIDNARMFSKLADSAHDDREAGR